jgi:uncharacterized protein YecT (DUF1311 family)
VNKILVAIALLASSFSMSSQEPASQNNSCFDKATTQSEINVCATDGLKKADAELNQVYQQLLEKHATDKEFVRRLRLAQEAWVKFRDAQVECMYPASHENQLQAEGSVYPMCKDLEITRLIVDRTKTLKRMLNPQEGDVCAP